MTRLAAAGGGRGGGRGADPSDPLIRMGFAKNGLMATMPATSMTLQAYSDAKSQVPKAISDAAALLDRAQALSSTLATHNITLAVPARREPTTTPERGRI
jgi:hypothetical protein